MATSFTKRAVRPAYTPDFVAGVVAEYGHRSAVETAHLFGLPSKSAVCGIWYRARRDGLVERRFASRPRRNACNTTLSTPETRRAD